MGSESVKVIACYPRTMSAWLSNLLTIPDWSLYAHDALHQPYLMAALRDVDVPYKGVVDTGAGVENLSGGGIPDGAEITVIEADLDWVKDKNRKYFGHDMDENVEMLARGMKRLRHRGATVYRFEDWDKWIWDLYKEHTGLDMDWDRYWFLLNLNVQSQFARGKHHDGKR